MTAIVVSDLTKAYGDLVAVDGLSFTVEDGEIFGLLGPNGAGKSTLINTLCTLLTPTSGTASVAGHDVRTETGAVRASLGVVFQEPALDEELTAAENLAFHANLYGMRAAEYRDRLDDVLALVDLADRRDTRVREFSGGMKRRLELARGLLHRPEVLFLDEPTVGLDAGTRRDTREYIQRLNDETGVTVVLTTHYMEEADALCDRVAIVDRGRLVALDTPAALKADLGGETVTLTVGDASPAAVADRLERLDWVREVAVTTLAEGAELRVVVDHASRRVPVLVTEAAAVATVLGVDVERPSLEGVFLALTGRKLDAGGDARERGARPTAATADGGTE